MYVNIQTSNKNNLFKALNPGSTGSASIRNIMFLTVMTKYVIGVKKTLGCLRWDYLIAVAMVMWLCTLQWSEDKLS